MDYPKRGSLATRWRARSAGGESPAAWSTTTTSCRRLPRGELGRGSRPRGPPPARGRRSADGSPDALAGFGSAKCSNEEAYLFQKLVRAVLGTNNVDHCTRLCHASSRGRAAADDRLGRRHHHLRRHPVNSDVALITGTNTTANHPVAATFFKDAARKGTKLIVVDPRRSGISDQAWRFCQIRSGADVAFYNGDDARHHRRGLHGRRLRRPTHHGLRRPEAHRQGLHARNRVSGICGIPVETAARGRPRTTAGPGRAHILGHGHEPARARHGQRAVPASTLWRCSPGMSDAPARASTRSAVRTTCRALPTQG